MTSVYCCSMNRPWPFTAMKVHALYTTLVFITMKKHFNRGAWNARIWVTQSSVQQTSFTYSYWPIFYITSYLPMHVQSTFLRTCTSPKILYIFFLCWRAFSKAENMISNFGQEPTCLNPQLLFPFSWRNHSGFFSHIWNRLQLPFTAWTNHQKYNAWFVSSRFNWTDILLIVRYEFVVPLRADHPVFTFILSICVYTHGTSFWDKIFVVYRNQTQTNAACRKITQKAAHNSSHKDCKSHIVLGSGRAKLISRVLAYLLISSSYGNAPCWNDG